MTVKLLIHSPYGLEHPYEQLPEERFPRHPLAGQPFTVGVVARPIGAFESVWLHSTLDGVAQPPILANRLADWRPELEHGVGAEYLERIVRIEQDVWQAKLTAPAIGHTLTYWFEADGVKTESFTLTGEDWVSAGGLTSNADGRVTLTRAADAMSASTLPTVQSIEWLTDGQRARRVRVRFACDTHDGFYGLGERFNALNQRGNTLDVRCYEQYKNQGKRTYMPIPFLLVWSAQQAHGYGLFVESARWMQFELAASASDSWVLEADLGTDERLTFVPYHGADPYAIVGQFAQATGPTVLPPQWAFGLWMSSNEWNSQARVLHEVEQTLKHEIPASVLVIEAWSDETTFYIWNDAEYTPQSGDHVPRYGDFRFPQHGKWPDPKAMTDYLHAQGIKLLLWQIPVLKATTEPHAQHDADRAHYTQSGFGVHEADGSLHKVKPFWFRGGALWDVTNPD
jgi:alpha-glucosidase (family GH31 glycosyl hydrolase)